MGWKIFKEFFGITHPIDRHGDELRIGSGYIHDLLRVNLTTGVLIPKEGFASFAQENYPQLAAASPEQIQALLEQVDSFDQSVPVYVYEDGQIVVRYCEQPGYPNTTHDGYLMRNNYSADKAAVIARAKEGTAYSLERISEHIAELQAKLDQAQKEHVLRTARLHALNTEYPE